MENIKALLGNITFFAKSNSIELILILGIVFFSATITDWALSKKHRNQTK